MATLMEGYLSGFSGNFPRPNFGLMDLGFGPQWGVQGFQGLARSGSRVLSLFVGGIGLSTSGPAWFKSFSTGCRTILPQGAASEPVCFLG